MTIEELNEYADTQDEVLVVFSNPSYETAIVGVSYDNRVIYDYELMVEYLMKEDNLSQIDAIEFIEYNTIRALSYQDNAPIILFKK